MKRLDRWARKLALCLDECPVKSKDTLLQVSLLAEELHDLANKLNTGAASIDDLDDLLGRLRFKRN